MPTTNEVSCPKCGGAMWDNRQTKRNPKQPDYKCRTQSCEGVIWPPRAPNGTAPAPVAAPANVKQPITLGGPIAGLDEPTTDDHARAKRAALFLLHNSCFEQALMLVNSAEANHSIKANIEAVSALTAQLFIAATQRGAA